MNKSEIMFKKKAKKLAQNKIFVLCLSNKIFKKLRHEN